MALPLSHSQPIDLTQAPELPAVLAGDRRFRVLRELGRGGMGIVYEAIERASGQRVALKVPQAGPDALARLAREAQLGARVAHPNIVAVHAHVARAEGAFLVMERVVGGDLRRWVRSGGRCDQARLWSACLQLLEALAALHDAGIVHGDVKPGNVIVAGGQPKLIDFGLASACGQARDGGDSLDGTPSYMAPEQVDRQPLDGRTDLYALGVVVYELLVGEPPFVGAPPRVLDAHRRRAPELPSQRMFDALAPALELWLLTLLAKRPADRFAGARQAAQALVAALPEDAFDGLVVMRTSDGHESGIIQLTARSQRPQAASAA